VASDAATFDVAMERLRTLGGGGGRPPIEPQLAAPDDPDMEARLKRVEDDVRALRGDMFALLTRQGTMEARLGVLEGKVEGLQRQIDGLQKQIDGLQRQIGDLAATIRGKVIGPWQTLVLVIGLLTASLALPGAVNKLLSLIP